MKDSIVSIEYGARTVCINLKIKSVAEHTHDLPGTVVVLQKYLPSIFSNKCFNGDSKTFYEEVTSTETAHLFEHIILENMCLEKIKTRKSAVFNGRTFWNKRNNNKCYQIRLDLSPNDWPIFANAFAKSLNLVNLITLS